MWFIYLNTDSTTRTMVKLTMSNWRCTTMLFSAKSLSMATNAKSLMKQSRSNQKNSHYSPSGTRAKMQEMPLALAKPQSCNSSLGSRTPAIFGDAPSNTYQLCHFQIAHAPRVMIELSPFCSSPFFSTDLVKPNHQPLLLPLPIIHQRKHHLYLEDLQAAAV